MTTPKHVSCTLKADIARLRPHYLSSTSTDQARRQMLDHFDAFADRLAAIQPEPEPVAGGCGYPCWYDCNGACFDGAEPQPVACPCTMIEQDESCPVGYPSLLCDDCNGIGILPDTPSIAGMVSVEAAGWRAALEEIRDSNGWEISGDDLRKIAMLALEQKERSKND